MRVDWPENRCILCLEEGLLSEEHIIPKSLGGSLTCSFLCNTCNSTLGATYEAEAKSDPSIRFAVNNLQSQIPNLATRLTERQFFITDGPGGKQRGQMKNGTFRVTSRELKDGSLIQPTDLARKSVEKILKKSGLEGVPLENAMQNFDDVPDNQIVNISDNLEVKKWTTEKIEIDLKDSKLMSPLIPLKIGYEFLACHLGQGIYDDAPQFNELRIAIINGLENEPFFEVERLNTSKYETFHGICYETAKPYSRVLIRLFGWLAFRVHFKRLSIGGPRFIFTQYLDTGREDIRILETEQ